MKIKKTKVSVLLTLVIILLLTKIIFDNSSQRFDLCKTDDGYSVEINIENVIYYLDFYPDGNIKKISQKNDGSAKGLQQSFYKNGRLFFSTTIDENKKPIGDQVLFNSDGTIQKVERIKKISSTNSMLEKIYFLETGISINSSYFFSFYLFEAEKNSLIKRYLEILYHSDSIIQPISIYFGIYDKGWNLKDSSNITVVEMVNNACVIEYDEFQKYGDTLRGELLGITSSKDTFYTPVEFVW